MWSSVSSSSCYSRKYTKPQGPQPSSASGFWRHNQDGKLKIEKPVGSWAKSLHFENNTGDLSRDTQNRVRPGESAAPRDEGFPGELQPKLAAAFVVSSVSLVETELLFLTGAAPASRADKGPRRNGGLL